MLINIKRRFEQTIDVPAKGRKPQGATRLTIMPAEGCLARGEGGFVQIMHPDRVFTLSYARFDGLVTSGAIVVIDAFA
jgi:hypothetical protein